MKINLIIDGNYILNKSVFTLHKYKALFGELHESLEKTVKGFKSLYFFDNIFFVSDSGTSWRKNIYTDYKANRSKSDDIDWDFVYTAYREFKEELPPNVTLLEAPQIEGDDWIARIVLESNKKGYANLIISNDHDIKQLLKFSLSPLYMNLMSNEMFNREKVFLPNNYEIFMQKLHQESNNNDLFNLSKDAETLNFLNKFTERREKHIVDDKESLITKVISGDKSDNIKSVFQKATKSGKMRGVGEAGAKKIYKKYFEEFGEMDLDDNDLFENIADLVVENKKGSFDDIPKVVNRISDNLQLISLFDLPDYVVDQIDEKIIKRFN
jgi:5'-3' exonuclease